MLAQGSNQNPLPNPKEKFIETLRAKFPQLGSENLSELIADNLLSPFVVNLPPGTIEQGAQIIRDIYSYRNQPSYLEKLGPQAKSLGLRDPGNKAIMMSYDFHLTPEGQLKLIEINTNAAFLILGALMYEIHQRPLPVSSFQLKDLRACILEELRLFGNPKENPKVAIIDDAPANQRLFIEFLVAQELMRSWGWKCEILDFRECLKHSPDFIYNRHTDFYLNKEDSKPLLEAFLQKKTCMSPHPYEYFLLADKERMTEWSQDPSLPFFKSLPISRILHQDNKDEVWKQRKSLFFKPARAHGSKGSFKGESVSRKVFEEMLAQNALAQEYVQAPETEFNTPQGPQKFKYDLRFYAYQDQLQMVCARLYQGQTTNLRTLYGGFAPIS